MRQAWQGAFGALIAFGSYTATAHAQLMIVGNDEKLTIDDAGKSVPHEPGHDTLSIIDISKPEAPKIVASIPLMNTIAGPPTNLAIHPSGEIALVANSLNPEPEGSGWKNVPDDKVFVIDLKANPPAIIATVNAGKQVSGMAISPKGDLAVAVLLQGSNADKKAFYYHPTGAVVALKIDGKKVTKVGEVQVGALPEGVAFSPKGDYLYVGNFLDQDMSVLKVDGDKITDTGKRFKLPGHPASMRAGPQ